MSKAYQSGYNAMYFGGVSFHANPYAVDTTSYKEWAMGWKACCIENGLLDEAQR